MRWVVDLLYAAFALVTAPIWLWRMIRTGKIRTDWTGRFGAAPRQTAVDRPTVLLHAVSVGEINAIRLLVDRLARHAAKPRIVIATTTNTGAERARRLFADAHVVVRYPLDFSFAVDRFLGRIRPDVVALVELEVWPNFTSMCARRSIPICVINGRLTARSARGYAMLGPMIRPAFQRVACAAVQTEEYARRFQTLGARDVRITGSMKWDTAQIEDTVDGADRLAEEMGINRDRPLIVAGSTAPGEHELLMQAAPPEAQLLCAPRKPEWFDQAADVLVGCARRSRGDRNSSTGRFLLDTIGELRQAYALADLVVVGRSFGQLHGSDMIEPVALGKAVVVGPAVTDFQHIADALISGDGLVQTDRQHVREVLRALLDDAPRRSELAANGRAIIRNHQGATDRHVRLIMSLLDRRADQMQLEGMIHAHT
jgi:3-deoxy-D-manno-octulosonic-acid transferase